MNTPFILQVDAETAEMLEWPEFLRFYSGFSTSEAAARKILKTRPSEGLPEDLEMTGEVLGCALKSEIPSLAGLEDISAILQQTKIANHVCEGMDLYHIYRFCVTNQVIGNYRETWKREFPHLSERCSRFPDLRLLEHEIGTKIEPNGEVKEDATSELKRLMKQILNLQSRVEHALERFFRDTRYRNVLQEDYVTYRHGRAVLLVRAEEKSTIRGVVHGESGSGASLFLEPFGVLELNNELARLRDRQSEEINRILKELTALTGKHADLLEFALRNAIEMDVLFARGRFGKAFRCIVPLITDSQRFHLVEARHPLLENTLTKQNKAVVPLSFELSENKKALVITGPNTGGKTVFLKTAGLLSLMAHSAIPIPAAEGTTLPRLTAIAADIGDRQSIEESLSTFSSHITNIVRILADIRPGSLVLLDELGTGTDPEEGAPLAVAVLQEILKHDVRVMITSHHGKMKMFAFQHPLCVTAAMEFDQEALTPTYRIRMDEIGASHAFEIAGRLGMTTELLKQAKDLADPSQRELEEFQKQLQERIRQLETRQQELERERSDWENEANMKTETLQKTEQRLEEQRKVLREKNTDLIRTLNARVEGLVTSIRDAQTRQQFRKQYQEQVAPVMEKIQATTSPVEPETPSGDFAPGERVWVQMYKEYGEVVSIKKDTADLIIRNKRFQVPVGMLEKRETIAQSLPKGIRIEMEEKSVASELNVIGMTVDEALEATDKYLDDAFLSQLPEVRLIHGYGTGKLRKAISEFLSTHAHVKSFASAKQDRGGTAVTVVQLKT